VERKYRMRLDGGNVGQSGNRDLYDHGPTVGGDVITATYSGDSNHGGSSGTLSPNQQVNGSPTTISVTNVSPAAEDYGSTRW